jgi:uncharacterized protein (DUF433 family)
MSWEERIEINPQVLVGKPVIKGTRLAVEFIVELLASGWSEQQIIDNYPGLTIEDLHACLHYAADTLMSERVYLTP